MLRAGRFIHWLMPVPPIIVTIVTETMVSHYLSIDGNISMVCVRVEQQSSTAMTNGTALINSKVRSSKAHT